MISCLGRLLLAAATLPSAALAATFAGVEVPAPLPPRSVVETHWNTQVDDPYRYLEETANPEIQKYMRAQADAAQAILDRIPERDKLLARIKVGIPSQCDRSVRMNVIGDSGAS